MTNPERDRLVLVVGHDGTPASDVVVDWAAGVAAAGRDVRVELVHAVTLPPIPRHGVDLRVDELLGSHESEARQALDAAVRRLAERGLETGVEVRRWLPAETILARAKELGAGLVVVGRHAGRAAGLWLGGTSSEVARDAEAPVVVVRGERPASPPRRVLLAFDGSPSARRAAVALATWMPAAEITVAVVHGPGAGDDRDAIGSALATAGLATERLEIRIVGGEPAPTLLALAEDEPFDLVAAGRHGHAGWRERILGGVSEKLLQLSPCPVLVAH